MLRYLVLAHALRWAAPPQIFHSLLNEHRVPAFWVGPQVSATSSHTTARVIGPLISIASARSSCPRQSLPPSPPPQPVFFLSQPSRRLLYAAVLPSACTPYRRAEPSCHHNKPRTLSAPTPFRPPAGHVHHSTTTTTLTDSPLCSRLT